MCWGGGGGMEGWLFSGADGGRLCSSCFGFVFLSFNGLGLLVLDHYEVCFR